MKKNEPRLLNTQTSLQYNATDSRQIPSLKGNQKAKFNSLTVAPQTIRIQNLITAGDYAYESSSLNLRKEIICSNF